MKKSWKYLWAMRDEEAKQRQQWLYLRAEEGWGQKIQ